MSEYVGSSVNVYYVDGENGEDTSINWTKKTFSANDILEFEIDAVDTMTNCNISLKIVRNG